jgi:nuclear transport factor 2 (NTF2) superfamily protein
VRQLYAAFNSRNVERLLTLVTDDVHWPAGPARMRGKDAARDYWVRQWSRVRSFAD